MHLQQVLDLPLTRACFHCRSGRARVACPIILAVLFTVFTAFHATAAVFTVTSISDGPTGATLRTAMLNANLTPGRDTISFAISGTGPHTIGVQSPLPQLIDNAGVLIDGQTIDSQL